MAGALVEVIEPLFDRFDDAVQRLHGVRRPALERGIAEGDRRAEKFLNPGAEMSDAVFRFGQAAAKVGESEEGIAVIFEKTRYRGDIGLKIGGKLLHFGEYRGAIRVAQVLDQISVTAERGTVPGEKPADNRPCVLFHEVGQLAVFLRGKPERVVILEPDIQLPERNAQGVDIVAADGGEAFQDGNVAHQLRSLGVEMVGQVVRLDLPAAGTTVLEQFHDRVKLRVLDQGVAPQSHGLEWEQTEGQPVQAVHIGGVDVRADGTGYGGANL